MTVDSDFDSINSQPAAFTVWNVSGTAFLSLLSQTPSARLTFWQNQVVIQCTTTFLTKKLHRAQQWTENPSQEYWGKDTRQKRDGCHVTNSRYTSFPPFPNVSSCKAVETCTGMMRAGCLTGDLLLAGPVRPERGWPRMPRLWEKPRTAELGLGKKKKKAECQVKRQIYSGREWHWSYLKLQVSCKVDISRFRNLSVKLHPVSGVSKEINIKSEC